MVTTAKGLTSGYLPMGAMLVAPRVADPFFQPDGGVWWRHGYTDSGHATAAAVALANLAIIEREGRKIRVNSLNPGLIETEGVKTAGFDKGDFRKGYEAQAPLGRIGQVDDISPTAVYLASSDSKFLTGESIRVTGGI